jgi:hypothetical protein
MDFTNPWSERVFRSIEIRKEECIGIQRPAFSGR